MINENIIVGTYNTLIISRESENGLYLKANDENEVLLPNAYVKDEMLLGDLIDAFVYRDSEDRLVATTLTPKATIKEFAYMKVVDQNEHGYFLDWGLPKDLFVPKKEQKGLKVGESSIFFIDLDKRSDRLYASQKIGKFLQSKVYLKTNEEVEILPFAKTPLGYKAIINNSYSGMIYDSEIFEDITLGVKIKAYVKKVRRDGLVDLKLQACKKDKLLEDKEKILKELMGKTLKLDLNYKSSPELIKEKFGLSKKAYKRALTSLIEEKKIEVGEDGMKIVQ